MKNFLLLLFFTFSNILLSQTEPKTFKDKYQEFDYYAKPSPNNTLSAYFKSQLDPSLFETFKYSDTASKKKRVFVHFELNNENKPIKIVITSPYIELNLRIKSILENYGFEKFNIPEKNPSNQYLLQILSFENDKTIINCSTNIVYDQLPIFEGCDSTTSFSKMESCINKKLEEHIVKNLSPKAIEYAKILGKINLKPNFLITEKGTIEKIKCKTPSDSLTKELIRVISLFPVAKTPPLRNGKPTRLFFTGSVSLIVDTTNETYAEDVIKSKDSTLNPNGELALHFKNFITEEEISKYPFLKFPNKISINFTISKKGKLNNLTASSRSEILNKKLIEIFNKFPFEKLNIKSTNVLESYSYTIFTVEYNNKIVIQCNDKPNVFLTPCYDKYCEKSDSPEELKKCFNESISSYIVKNINHNIINDTKILGDIITYCAFSVAADGKIVVLKVQAPNPIIANELEEILKRHPNIYKPAYYNGVAIGFAYRIPVVLKSSSYIPQDSSKSTINTYSRSN